MVKIAPSVLSADFGRLAEEVAKVEAVADLLHVDVMDGRFVPNFTIGPPVVEAIHRHTRLPLDVHLMVEAPERFIEEFARAGAASLTVHVETCPHLHRTIQQIHEAGVRAGVALNPATPIVAVEHVLDQADLLLVMSVDPGFGGQTFIPFALPKIEALARRLDCVHPRPELEVDGGIHADNCREIAKAGATILVAGSAVFGAADPRAAVQALREMAGRGA
jgi:ribulose-phosphate 3-epimerase